MQPKAQLNVRVNHACVRLIKLERQNIPGCASDGEALESIIFRSATSPAARKIIIESVVQEPIFAAAAAAWEVEHADPARPGLNFPVPPPSSPPARSQHTSGTVPPVPPVIHKGLVAALDVAVSRMPSEESAPPPSQTAPPKSRTSRRTSPTARQNTPHQPAH